MDRLLSLRVRCFSLRQQCATYWYLLDEQMMSAVERQLEEAAVEIGRESDPTELAHWQEMVTLLEQAIAHLAALYERRVEEQDLAADQREMMEKMRSVVI